MRHVEHLYFQLRRFPRDSASGEFSMDKSGAARVPVPDSDCLARHTWREFDGIVEVVTQKNLPGRHPLRECSHVLRGQ
jgi:hypothetical protein